MEMIIVQPFSSSIKIGDLTFRITLLFRRFRRKQRIKIINITNNLLVLIYTILFIFTRSEQH